MKTILKLHIDQIEPLEGEIFKAVPNYPNYQISSFGRLKSMKGKPKILMPQKHRKGYEMFTLNNGKPWLTTAHVIMAITFLDFVPNGRKLHVDHIDGIVNNNVIPNLQILSARQNVSKGYKAKETSSKYTGVSKHPHGGYTARITIDGKRKHLGYFMDEKKAAKSYNKAVLAIRVQTIFDSQKQAA